MENENSNNENLNNNPTPSQRMTNSVKNGVGNLAQKGAQAYLGAHGVPPQLTKAVTNKLGKGLPGQSNPLQNALSRPPAGPKTGGGLAGKGADGTQSSEGTEGKSKSDNSAAKGDTNAKTAGSGGFGSSLGAMGANAMRSLAGGKGSVVGNAKKAKLLIKFAPFIGGVFGILLIIIISVVLIMAPILIIGENLDSLKNSLATFGDKLGNFVTGNGFTVSSELIVRKLDDARNDYEANDCFSSGLCYESPFDEGILLATINHNNFNGFDTYDASEEEVSSEEYSQDKENLSEVTVDTEQTKSYYNVMDELLGSSKLNEVEEGERQLIYALTDVKLGWRCAEEEATLIDSAAFVTDLMGHNVDKFFSEVTESLNTINPVNIISELADIIGNINSFNDNGIDFKQHMKDVWDYEDENEKSKILLTVFNLGSAPDCSVSQYIAPYITRDMNYNNYFKYLKDVYIPTMYFNCDKCKENNYTDEQKNKLTKRIIEEIINERNAYYQSRKEKSYLYYKYDSEGNIVATLTTSYINYTGTIPVGTAGTGWRQADERWGSIMLGTESGSTMAKVGCYITSLATVMANSGTTINGEYFDPGVLAQTIIVNQGFTSGGGLVGANTATPPWLDLVPNFKHVESQNVTKMRNTNNGAEISNMIGNYLSQGYAVVLRVNDGGHFIAVVGSNEGEIIVSDPGIKAETSSLSDYISTITEVRAYNPNAQ